MPTVIIFGLDVSGNLSLSIEGPYLDPPGGTLPPMSVTTGGSTSQYAAKDGRWQVDLSSGQHLVRIEEGADEVRGSAVATITPAASGGTGVFVSHAQAGDNPPPFVGWTATAAGSDPKDPWPPPGASIPGYATAWIETAYGAQPKATARTRDG